MGEVPLYAVQTRQRLEGQGRPVHVLRLDPHELDGGSGGHAPPLPERLVVEGARFLLGGGSYMKRELN